MEKKLYALITNKYEGHGYGAIVVQVSFNKKELEEIAEYLNSFTYFGPHATVEEVTERVCEWNWPHSYRG